jgi:adenylate cyclase
MRGWALNWQEEPKPTKDKNDAALALFEQALKIDPNDADALAGEAASYSLERLLFANPETDYDTKVIGPADRAIALAPENMRAYRAKSAYLALSRRADESLRTADAGLAINPNYASLYSMRSTAKSSLGQFEQAKSDAQQAIRLSPRDPLIGLFHIQLGDAELGLGHFDAAIDEYHNATDSGYRPFFVYTNLAAVYALEGKMEEAKSALAEARRLNPAITVKWMKEHTPNLPPVFEGLRKAKLPEE